jgi:hypothetical protein
MLTHGVFREASYGESMQANSMYATIYQTKSYVMVVLGCNGLRCVINIILSATSSLYPFSYMPEHALLAAAGCSLTAH